MILYLYRLSEEQVKKRDLRNVSATDSIFCVTDDIAAALESDTILPLEAEYSPLPYRSPLEDPSVVDAARAELLALYPTIIENAPHVLGPWARFINPLRTYYFCVSAIPVVQWSGSETFDEVIETLRSLIAAGFYKVGDKLPDWSSFNWALYSKVRSDVDTFTARYVDPDLLPPRSWAKDPNQTHSGFVKVTEDVYLNLHCYKLMDKKRCLSLTKVAKAYQSQKSSTKGTRSSKRQPRPISKWDLAYLLRSLLMRACGGFEFYFYRQQHFDRELLARACVELLANVRLGNLFNITNIDQNTNLESSFNELAEQYSHTQFCASRGKAEQRLISRSVEVVRYIKMIKKRKKAVEAEEAEVRKEVENAENSQQNEALQTS